MSLVITYKTKLINFSAVFSCLKYCDVEQRLHSFLCCWQVCAKKFDILLIDTTQKMPHAVSL